MNGIAIDPGVTTGVAIRKGDEITTLTITETFNLFKLIKAFKDEIDYVAIENFAAVNISKYGLHTARLVGSVSALCWEYNLKLCLHQPAFRYPCQMEAENYLKHTEHVIHQTEALAHLFIHEEVCLKTT